MTKLYELATELQTINDQLITDQGEISPDLEKRLDEVNLALTEKATGIRKWFAMIETDSAGLDAEIKRLERMKKTQENLQTRLKEYVKRNMEIAGITKIQTPIGTFAIQANPPSVEIISEEMVPDSFKVVVPEHKELDKKTISEALKAGYDVPGAKLITDKTHIRIK